MAESNQKTYDEDLEGFYEVSVNVAKIYPYLAKKVPWNKCFVAFIGDKLQCDGNFVEHDGIKYLHVTHKNDQGYIPTSSVSKL